MKSLLRSVVRAAIPYPDAGAFVPVAAPGDAAARCLAALDAARDRLRAARAARDRAAGDLRAAEDRLRRALAVIDDSADADRASDEAEATARAASRAWTAAGCPEDRKPDRDLLERASAAHAAAIDARVLADGARDAIPGLESAVASARAAIGSAESEVHDAARGVLVAKAEPLSAAMTRAALAFDEASREVQGLARALSGRVHPFGSASAAGALLARIRDALPVPPAQDAKDLMVHGAALDSDEWIARGRRLVDDPEAKF